MCLARPDGWRADTSGTNVNALSNGAESYVRVNERVHGDTGAIRNNVRNLNDGRIRYYCYYNYYIIVNALRPRRHNASRQYCSPTGRVFVAPVSAPLPPESSPQRVKRARSRSRNTNAVGVPWPKFDKFATAVVIARESSPLVIFPAKHEQLGPPDRNIRFENTRTIWAVGKTRTHVSMVSMSVPTGNEGKEQATSCLSTRLCNRN